MSRNHVHDTRPNIVKRLKRAEGHLRRVIEMFDEGRSCLDLAQQLHAVEKAVRRDLSRFRQLARADDLSSLAKADIRLRSSGSDFDPRVVRSSPRWGVVKSLALIGAGPVALLHTQNPGIKSERPLKAEVNVGSRTVVVSL